MITFRNIMVPVRVVLVICCINNKINNSTGEFGVLSLGFSSFWETNLLLVHSYTICYYLLQFMVTYIHTYMLHRYIATYINTFVITSSSESCARKVNLTCVYAFKKCDDYREYFTYNSKACIFLTKISIVAVIFIS